MFGVIQRKPCFKTFNDLVGNIELWPNSIGVNIVPHKDVGGLGLIDPEDVLATLLCKWVRLALESCNSNLKTDTKI